MVTAHRDCRRRKRNTKSAIAFELHQERNLYELHQDLISGRYRPGKSTCFVITRPRPREVWAADYRDRVVHHLLYNHVAPRFIAGFVAGSSACIPGRGTLYAATRLESDVRSITQNWSKRAFFLQCDLSNFFVSISKEIVFGQLCEKLPRGWWRDLAETILFHDPRTNVDVRGNLDLVPPHKSLFNAPDDHGLPIGNLDSQFLANVHLNALDQFVVHQLRCRYVRYVDDFILLHESPAYLLEAYELIQEFLTQRLRLFINPTKTVLQPIEHGIDFVGQVIRPWRRTVRPRTANAAVSRLRSMPSVNLFEAGNSYLGLTSQASHGHADATRIANTLRRRGHCVAGDISKVYRRKQHER
ncbi:RNA-directed DNA polymerase [Paracandidimonas soli]|uniref:RNA-directed DNA polymerase n=1 Tax=Paracandidimonas soli TaxID=1917182 RepID=UPI00360A6CDB